MSQPAICNKCKDAGFTNELIKFEQAGTKPDGSKKWRVLNAADGSEHVHKSKEAPKPSPATPQNTAQLTPEQQRAAEILRLHNENIEASKALTKAIQDLATAIGRLNK